jgi:hypothetical protein
MASEPDHVRGGDNACGRFLALLREGLESGAFIALVLGNACGADPDLKRVSVRRILLRGQDRLSFVRRYGNRDVTENLPIPHGLEAVGALLGSAFRTAHLCTATADVQFDAARSDARALRRGKPTRRADASGEHDRQKERWVDPSRPFLASLGVTDRDHRVLPSMSRKWKQINKFLEIFSHAVRDSELAGRQTLRVADFGAGKGYLTFAVHDYLSHTLGVGADVTGIELREDLVALCNGVVAQLGLAGLTFRQGGLESHAPEALDVMIALHACDTATDLAIHRGVRAGAAVILCAPCCHKQLRPQLQAPAVLRPVLRFGVHADQEAEMVTDSLRALLLESRGYEAKVFEFISLEHTSKNKMILAVRRGGATGGGREAEALARVAELKAFYGIREHALESLLLQSLS